ncbi:unnamed protein product [Phytophthora lilii]|uniref:Unnamed protein product n=1 Tax=Phytophthora lilii TaxID=2077276 RepID=A0A9W6WM10_9STRA|nr:unnamed protein product [Phytophthora lilii]
MFIESRELREMLKGDEVDDEEEDEMETTLNENFDASGSIESVIESNYLFKTPIGVASLYQHANNSLRRAVALNPSSAMFVEHYVQLLVLVGDIQPACDYLEAFYNMNPGDPHGPRMPYSPGKMKRSTRLYDNTANLAIGRWMKNDPASSYPLEKMLEFSSAGAVSSFVLTKVLVEALDTCGSDSYVAENPEMALTLWRNLAELLTAMDEDEFMLDQADRWDQETIADVGAQRLWWKRVYFARPNTADEVAAISKCDSTFMEVCIYRAAVADRLFPGHISIANALSSAMASSGMTFSREHLRLFKSPVLDSKRHRSFSGMAFMHVVVDTDDKDANRVLPIFKGSSDTLHVIDRKSVVEIEPPGDQATVVVTRTGEAEGVDPQFVEELYDALEFEVGSNNQRPHRKRKADAMLSSAEPIAIPAYITMVEEEVYNNPTAIVSHIYSALYQKLRRSDMLLPTSRTVTYCVNYFRARLKKNRELYGHSGLMMRYETFITMYVHRQRAKGVFEVTTNTVKAAIQEMKRVLPSPHPHFPDEELVKETMRTKLGILVRQRRLRLMEMKEMMKWLLKQLMYVDEKNFVEVVYSACMQNGLLGVVTRVDVARLLQNILPLHYYAVLQDMQPRHMKMLTSSRLRKLYNTPEEIYEKAMEYKSRPTIEEIKALLWVERYEALYGPIADFDEESDSESDSSSESSSESSSSSDSDSSDTDG